MANSEDRLPGLVEVADDVLNALVDADLFRHAAAGDVDRIVFFRLHRGEAFIQLIEMAGLFRVSLIALEIVQRRLDHVEKMCLFIIKTCIREEERTLFLFYPNGSV